MGPISFPGLGIEVNPPVSIDFSKLGLNYEIHFYGIVIALGLLLCGMYGFRRGKDFGLTEDDIFYGVMSIVPFAFICARLYYCAFSWEKYAAKPIEILYIWEGGLAIYGGVIGAIIGIVVYCLLRKIPISTVLDITFVTFPLGQAIGRWGNFFNREAFGAETEFFLRMGLEDKYGTVTYHHPTFLYESVWNLLIFAVLHFLSKKRKYDGQMFLGYVVLYGLGRTFIESLRMDSLYWGPFRVSQLLAAVSCAVAAGILLYMSFKPHDPAKLYVNRVAAKKAEEGIEETEEVTEETEEVTEETEEVEE